MDGLPTSKGVTAMGRLRRRVGPVTPTIACSERLLVVVGPSGVGKDTVMAAWRQRALETGLDLRIARRSITRPAEAGGEPHEAMSAAQWQAACDDGDFALHWRANSLGYGVRRRELQALESGPLLLNGSRAALAAIREIAPRCRVIELGATAAVIALRLQMRGREDAESIAQRLRRAVPVHADIRVSNDGAIGDCVAALMHWWDANRERG